MAALDFMYRVAFTATPGLETVCQFQAPVNQRTLLHEVELIPKGATGASAPLHFDLSLQDDAGVGSTDVSSDMEKHAPVASESLQTKVRTGFSTEPSTSTPKHVFSLHMQGARTYRPLKPIVIEGNTRLGFRFLNASLNPACDFVFHLEE
jgi:hypothetical protein